MNLSVVIPNYNGEKIIGKNLPKVLASVKDYSSGSVEIIISDDCSSDSSLDIIQEFIESNKKSSVKIKLFTSLKNKNEGFSSNVNRGVRAATGEVLILLNTDVIPSKNFLKPLLKHFENPEVFAVGCMDESLENGKLILRGRGVGKWEKGFMIHSAGDLEKKDTLWVSGGSGAFRKSIWDKLGGLDTLYNPFYWEDIDLSYRAKKSGYLTLFEKESVVRHEHDEGVIKEKYKPDNVKKVVYRNQFIFAWKNSDFGNLIKNILWFPFHFITSLIGGDYLLLAGFFKALILLPKIIRSRIISHKQFILTDRQVIQSLE